MSNVNLSIAECDFVPSQFENLLRRLDPDRDRAAEKYEDLRRRLMRFFRWNQCFPPEDLADQTLDRTAQKSESDEIRDIAGFVWGVAKNVVRECRRRPCFIGMEGIAPGQEPQSGNAELQLIYRKERERRARCLHACLQRLSDSDRKIFIEYEYYSVKGLKTELLAKNLGLSIGALQVRAHRVKNRVEQCAIKTIVDSQIPCKMLCEFSSASQFPFGIRQIGLPVQD